MPLVFAALTAVVAIPLLVMIVTCVLERVEATLVPDAERVVRTTSVPSAAPASPASERRTRHLALVRGDTGDETFDPDATAQLRWVS